MQYKILEGMKEIVRIAGKMLPAGLFKTKLKKLCDRYISFGVISSSVEKIIKWSKFEDGMLHIKLNNGLEYYAPLRPNTELRDKYAIFIETYKRLMEQFVMGVYEKNYQLQKGDIVIDVGASWGFNTVDFSRKVGDGGTIVAIEPHVESLVILRKNLELNKCKNVIVIEKGLWNKKDKLELFIKERPEGNSLLISRGKVKTTEVGVDTLDNILGELEIDKVALIKMDIEGAEIKALKGMGKTLSNNGTRIVIAAYHIVDGQPTYKTIIPTMEAIGFRTILDGRKEIAYFDKRG